MGLSTTWNVWLSKFGGFFSSSCFVGKMTEVMVPWAPGVTRLLQSSTVTQHNGKKDNLIKNKTHLAYVSYPENNDIFLKKILNDWFYCNWLRKIHTLKKKKISTFCLHLLLPVVSMYEAIFLFIWSQCEVQTGLLFHPEHALIGEFWTQFTAFYSFSLKYIILCKSCQYSAYFLVLSNEK